MRALTRVISVQHGGVDDLLRSGTSPHSAIGNQQHFVGVAQDLVEVVNGYEDDHALLAGLAGLNDSTSTWRCRSGGWLALTLEQSGFTRRIGSDHRNDLADADQFELLKEGYARSACAPAKICRVGLS